MKSSNSFVGWLFAGILGAIASTAFGGLVLPLIDKDFFSYPGCWIRDKYFNVRHSAKSYDINNSINKIESQELEIFSEQYTRLRKAAEYLVTHQVTFERVDENGHEFERGLRALDDANSVQLDEDFEAAYRDYVSFLYEYNAPRAFISSDYAQSRILSYLNEPESCYRHFQIRDATSHTIKREYIPLDIRVVEIPSKVDVIVGEIEFIEEFGSLYRLDESGRATWR